MDDGCRHAMTDHDSADVPGLDATASVEVPDLWRPPADFGAPPPSANPAATHGPPPSGRPATDPPSGFGPPASYPPSDFGPPATYPPSYPPPGYQPQPARSRRWGRAGSGAAAGAGAAAKAGLLAKLFVLFKSATVLVKFKFIATMALSVIAYTWIYGWAFAVGLIAMLVIHEFGHVAVFRMQGVKMSLPTFIPFLGAYVKAESPVKSVGHAAVGALGGPAAGLLASLAALELSRVVNSPLLQVIAYAGFFITFFNLIPLWILDGATIARVLHWGVFAGALVVGLVVEIERPSRMLPLIVIFGAVALFERWKNRAQYAAAYRATSPTLRGWVGAGYAIIGVICLWGINVTYIPR